MSVTETQFYRACNCKVITRLSTRPLKNDTSVKEHENIETTLSVASKNDTVLVEDYRKKGKTT